MFGTDQRQPDQPSVAARRLTGLGLIPDSPGWVPEQPPVAARPVAEPARPAPEPSPTTPGPIRPVSTPTVTDAVRAALADRLPPWTAGLVDRVTIGGLVWTVAALIAAVVAGVLYLQRHGAISPPSYQAASSYGSSPSSGSAAQPTAAAAAAPTSADTASIVVDVGGRVRKPGLVTLPTGARVADAITAAGGPLKHSELARVDLAARVTDGQLLLVGVKGAATVGATGATDSGVDSPGGSPSPVSLSTATLEELETLPGVGPVTAQKIVDWRSAHGGFTSVSQLQQVPGIGPAHYAEISPLVTP